MDEQLFEVIMQRFERLEEKVDKLLAFKWQIIGGSVLLSLLLTAAINLVATIF